MSECQMIVFSNKAYNAIIRESFDKDPVETGGILLGHVLDNGIWIVMEVLPPGIHCIFETAYFEYDDAFVNYLAQSVASQYKIPLELLGLWHRHPGSMDFFSATDDQTNATFAAQNSYGVISGLVNIDPKFRLTMYHLGKSSRIVPDTRPHYEKIPIEVGDDIIPESYFELRYYDGDEDNLHPSVDRATKTARSTAVNSSTGYGSRRSPIEYAPSHGAYRPNTPEMPHGASYTAENKFEAAVLSIIRFFRRNRFLLILLLLIVFLFSLKSSWKYLKTIPENTIEWIKGKSNNKGSITTIEINIGDSISLKSYRPSSFKSKGTKWRSSNDAVIIRNNMAHGVKEGEATVTATFEGKEENVVLIIVKGQKYRINKNSRTLLIGQADTVCIEPKVKKAKWVSADKSVATVDKNGVITAISEGCCTITCEMSGEIVGTCSIKVIKATEDNENDALAITENKDSTSQMVSIKSKLLNHENRCE